jgi:hypothetical protein
MKSTALNPFIIRHSLGKSRSVLAERLVRIVLIRLDLNLVVQIAGRGKTSANIHPVTLEFRNRSQTQGCEAIVRIPSSRSHHLRFNCACSLYPD